MSDQTDRNEDPKNVVQTLMAFKSGDTIDWNSPLRETFVYVELPFWIMTPPGELAIVWNNHQFAIQICPSWREVFFHRVTDSRDTVYHQGPRNSESWSPDSEAAELIATHDIQWLERPCKTVLRIPVHAHSDTFRSRASDPMPRASIELEAYWASLCEAHLPIVNELIQRYRLATYDYFAYEVSPWDVPIWYIKHAAIGKVLIAPYKAWDVKPGIVDGSGSAMKQMEYASLEDLSASSSDQATPGEFDLLDARSLMERGDYTGAVRRTVTAVETLVEWSLHCELLQNHSESEAQTILKKTKSNFPRRLAEWQDVSCKRVVDVLIVEFMKTRKTRHAIVHDGCRLTHDDRGTAQRSVDTGRWLFNQVEDIPHRARLRDYGTIKSVGRVALAHRLPVSLGHRGFTVRSLD